MAHEIATTNGRRAMFFHGDAPWHGLGTSVADMPTAAAAISLAGLDYEVETEPLYTAEGTLARMARASIRTDTGRVLGVVGPKWIPVQNRESFSFMDGLVGDEGLRYHTAGALRGGGRVWMLAEIPGHVRIAHSDDLTGKFLLLSNGHDGGSALRVYFTPIRVICANTLAMAERASNRGGVTIRHSGNIEEKMGEARRILGISALYFSEFSERANALAGRQVGSAALKRYFEAIFPGPEDPEKARRAAETRATTVSLLEGLFEGGIGQDMPGVKGTYWAAYNAVTEFVDHRPPTEKSGKEGRLENVWFGGGSSLKGRAFEVALEMATA